MKRLQHPPQSGGGGTGSAEEETGPHISPVLTEVQIKRRDYVARDGCRVTSVLTASTLAHNCISPPDLDRVDVVLCSLRPTEDSVCVCVCVCMYICVCACVCVCVYVRNQAWLNQNELSSKVQGFRRTGGFGPLIR